MKKSPFTTKEINQFKALLLEKKERILKELFDQSKELTEEKDYSGDLADLATNVLERSISLSLTNAERAMVNDIDEALERIADNSFGICIDTGTAIGKSRLKAMPEAKRTLAAQEKFDRAHSNRRKLGAK